MRSESLAFAGSEHVEGDVLDDGEVEGRVVGPHAAFVVAEDHVEHPVEAVVSRPEGFRLRPLAERCGSLSTHTAPIKQTRPRFLSASVRTDAAASLLCVRGAGLPASCAL